MADSRKILGVKGLNLHILADHPGIEEKFSSGLKITAVDGPCAVKYRFCVVNTLDGQTVCAVVYSFEEEFNAELSSGFKYDCIVLFCKVVFFVLQLKKKKNSPRTNKKWLKKEFYRQKKKKKKKIKKKNMTVSLFYIFVLRIFVLQGERGVIEI